MWFGIFIKKTEGAFFTPGVLAYCRNNDYYYPVSKKQDSQLGHITFPNVD